MIKKYVLKKIDFEILAFIKNNQPVHIDAILSKFPDNKFSTKYRLENLEKIESHWINSNCVDSVENSNYIFSPYTDSGPEIVGKTHYNKDYVYSLTELGNSSLQDNFKKIELEKRKFRKEFLLQSLQHIAIPIIISVITTLCTLGIKSFFK